MKKTLIKKKITALIVIVLLLAQMFSPYSILLNKSYAAVDTSKPLLSVVASEIETLGTHKIVKVTYAVTGENVQTIDLSIGFDKTKIAPANKKTGAAFTTSNIGNTATSCADYGTLTGYFDVDAHKYTSSTSNIRMTLSHPDGKGSVVNLSDEGFTKDDLGEEETYGHDYYMDAFTLYFYLVDESITELTTDMLYFSPIGSGMPTGFKYIYNNGSTDITVLNLDNVSYDGGFAIDERAVTGITVKTPPTNTTYDHGDTVNLAGGVLEVTYDNGDVEEVDMTDSSVKVNSGNPADVNDPKVVLEFGGETVDVNLTVNDPIDSLAVTNPMNDIDYNEGENFDFTGLALTATKRSGATVALTQSSTGVSTSELVASVSSPNFTKTSSTTDIETRGNQLITFTYEGKTANTTVIVNDSITGINLISQPTKQIYKRGESLDLTGAQVEVTLQSGTTATINLPDGSVTVGTYNPNTTGSKQSLSVRVGAFTSATNIEVEAYNYITSHTLITPTKDSYEYNDALELTGGRLRFTWKSGTGSPIQVNLTDPSVTVTGYDPTTIGIQTLTVTYIAKYTLSDGTIINDTITDTFNVEVTNPVTKIDITAPTKTAYKHGETLDLTGGDIEVTYKDGSTTHPAMSSATIVESDGSSVNMNPAPTAYTTNPLSKTLKITYSEDSKTKTINYPITIENYINMIGMNNNPTKTTYNLGDTTYDLTGGDILVSYAAGNVETVALSDSDITLTPLNTLTGTTGTKTVQVTYGGKNTGFNINVQNGVTGITITPPTDVTFDHGDTLTFGGGDIDVEYADGTHSHPAITSAMVKDTATSSAVNMSPAATDYDATTHDLTKNLEITYTEGVTTQTATYSITIKNPVDTVAISTPAPVASYNLNDTPSYPDGKVLVTRKAGDTETVDIVASMVTGLDTTSAGTGKTATVTYEGKSTTYTYDVIDNVTGITITAPTTTTYNHGDAINFTGADIEVTYASGTTSHPTMTTAMITEAGGGALNMSPSFTAYDSNYELTKALTITYTENGVTQTAPYNITLKNNVTGIAMGTNPTDTNYVINEASYKLAGGDIIVTRAAGNNHTVALTDSAISLSPISGITNTAGTKPVTVTYEGETTTFNVTVTNAVDTITITAPTDVAFNHGDTLTFNGGDIYITYLDGTDRHETITNAMVTDVSTGLAVNMSPAASEYNASHEIVKGLTITYTEDTVTKTENYNITLKNPVDTVAISTPAPVASYNLNDTPSYPDGKVLVTRKAGDTETVDIVASMVTGLDTTSAGTGKTATVTYEGKSTTYTYDVIDNVTGITITLPTKATYDHGEALDLTGGTITVSYAGGSTNTPSMTTAMITEADGSAVNMSPAYTDYTNNELNKTLVITYTENGVTQTENYPITIKNNVTGIAMGTLPTDTAYGVNESSYKLAGGDIIVSRAAGPTQTVDLTDPGITLTPITTLTGTPGTKTVTVTYEGETTTFDITVSNGVDTITITPPTDVTFNHGDSLTLGGGDIYIKYLDGTDRHETITNAMVTETSTGSAVNMSPSASDYNASHELVKGLTITYTEDTKTKTENYNITLKNPIDSIAIATSPATSYNLNDSTTGVTGTINVTRKAGDTDPAPVAITDSMVTGLDTTSAGTGKTATVTYTEDGVTVSTTYTYDVIDNVTGITITPPTKATYNHGEALDLTGGTITVSYAGGSTNTPSMTTAMITEADGSPVNMSPAYADYTNNELSKTLLITYTENGETKTENYPITIKNNVTGITMGTNPTDTTYDLNDSTYKLAGGDIVVTRAVGPTETVDLTDPAITLTDITTLTTTAGTKPVTVTYEGQTTSFNIEVQDAITAISISGTPKTEYEIGEAIDPTLSIDVVRTSGTTTIPVTSSMIAGFDTTSEGSKTAVITYEGLSTNYNYNVKDEIVSIAMGTTPKINYLVGETLDVTGGTITVTKKSGATDTVTIDPTMVSGFSSSSVVTGQTLTVTYNGLQTTYEINVTNPVSSITLNPGPTKTTYKYGESIDLTGASLDVAFENGTTDTMNVTSSMISGYDPNTLGTQTVTVTYGKNSAGTDVTTTFTVEVEDYVTGITVTGEKNTYNYGDPLDLTVGTVNVNMASGTPATAKALNDSDVTVTGYSATTVGNQTLTVTYGTESTTYNVEVQDYVASTSIVVPTKTTYNYGESLDLSTGKIVQTMASGVSNNLPLTTSMVTEADGTPVNMTPSSFDSTNKLNKTLKITSDGITENYPITIVNEVTSITIKQNPKTDYKYGDTQDTSTGSIEVTRGNGVKEEIPLSDSRITFQGFDTSTPGNNIPVTVKFTENGVTKQTTYTIDVNDNVTSIQLVGTPKTTYKYGESLSLSGLTLTVVRPSGTTPNVPVTANMVSGYNPNKLGNQTVKITYGGKQATYEVNVVDYLKDIELVKPTKVTYKKGETLDLTGASITEVMASGAKVTGIPVTESMVSSLDTTTEGTKTLTVKYTKDGKTYNKQFAVVVQDELSGITVKDFPVDEYLYGEGLDLTGATIEVELESGEKQTVPITKNMVTGYNSKPSSDKFDDSDEYIQVITIKYTKNGKTQKTTYPITTKDYLDKIAVDNLQDEYKYGESLNVKDATVAKVMASGAKKDKVQLTKDMVSGYNPKQEGNQTLTISYAGKTANEVVKVVDNVVAISIKKNPNKTTYDYGTALDLTGAKLNVTKYSGTTTIDITNDMVSGYDSNKEGTQTITVSYAGFDAEFSVKVLAKPETPVTPVTPEKTTTPAKSTTPTKTVVRYVTVPQSQVTEQPKVEEPKTEEPKTETPKVEKTETKKPVSTKPVKEEKPTKTLGVKEENKDTEDEQLDLRRIIALGIAGLGLLMLVILLILANRRNVKVYVIEENDEFVLGGLDKISKKNPKLDIDRFLDKETYPNRVKVHLNDSISEKLDGVELEITHRGQVIKHKVKYNDEPYEFILDAISEVEHINK